MSSADLSCFAPGRVELLGNHTDYNEGFVLSAALDLGVTVVGRGSASDRIDLSSEGFGGSEFPASGPFSRTGQWTDYVIGVVDVLKRAGHRVGGFEAHFSSNLPTGAGLSSSAAMEVATVVFLNQLFGLGMQPMDLARRAREAENQFVGVNCGLLDQVSSVFGKVDHAIFLDFRDELVETVAFPAGLRLLVVDSGVSHSLTGGEYNALRAQCEQAAIGLGVSALRDATPELLASTRLPDPVDRRAAHIIGENARVLEAVGCLRSGDAPGFGRLMLASHESSRVNFENSTSSLDLLVRIASNTDGVLGARLTGGGFGGAIIALVHAEAVNSAKDEIVEAYRRESGIQTRAFACRFGDGAAVGLGA